MNYLSIISKICNEVENDSDDVLIEKINAFQDITLFEPSEWSKVADSAIFHKKYKLINFLKDKNVKVSHDFFNEAILSNDLKHNLFYPHVEVRQLFFEMAPTPISFKTINSLMSSGYLDELSHFFTQKQVESWGGSRLVRLLEKNIGQFHFSLSRNDNEAKRKENLLKCLIHNPELNQKNALSLAYLKSLTQEYRSDFHGNFTYTFFNSYEINNGTGLVGLTNDTADLSKASPHHRNSALFKVSDKYAIIMLENNWEFLFQDLIKVGIDKERLLMLALDTQNISAIETFLLKIPGVDFKKNYEIKLDSQKIEIPISWILLNQYAKYDLLNKKSVPKNNKPPKYSSSLLAASAEKYKGLIEELMKNQIGFNYPAFVSSPSGAKVATYVKTFGLNQEYVKWAENLQVEFKIKKGISNDSSLIEASAPKVRF